MIISPQEISRLHGIDPLTCRVILEELWKLCNIGTSCIRIRFAKPLVSIIAVTSFTFPSSSSSSLQLRHSRWRRGKLHQPLNRSLSTHWVRVFETTQWRERHRPEAHWDRCRSNNVWSGAPCGLPKESKTNETVRRSQTTTPRYFHDDVLSFEAYFETIRWLQTRNNAHDNVVMASKHRTVLMTML